MRRALLCSAVVLAGVTPLAATAKDAVVDALGGAITVCTGAIAWAPDAAGASPRVEALRIAARAEAGADRIAIYAAEKDFTAQDLLVCKSGFCMDRMATQSGVTTSVLRLDRGLDYGGGRIQYDVQAAFTIVSMIEGAMVGQTTTGRGAFVCDGELAAGIAARPR